MELSDVELMRCNIDQGFDGFFDFVEVGHIGNQRIVHRECHNWLGMVDEFDNVLLPLIYDKLIPQVYGMETVIAVNDSELHGLYSIIDRKTILPVKFNAIYPAINYFWCREKHQWKLMSNVCRMVWYLSSNAIPLDHNKYICILVKKENCFNIEVLNENYNHSERNLREIAHESDIPNRIKMTSMYYKLIIYSDIYGNVIYSNINIDEVFSCVR